MSQKTTFISYRRDGYGTYFARAIESSLRQEGFDVFLDVDELESGRFEDQILQEINARTHFLMLLTKGALKKCESETDWFRREYFAAKKSGKNIIPIHEGSIELESLKSSCPDDMDHIFDLQMPKISHTSFKGDMKVIRERYLTKKFPSPEKTSIPVRLSENLNRFHVSTNILNIVSEVLHHPRYPRMMAIAHEVVPNPVWEKISVNTESDLLEIYNLRGPFPPKVMHLDMLLIRNNINSQRSQLWTYYSHAWKANLVSFRPWLTQDDPKKRSEMNRAKLAKYVNQDPESLSVTPIKDSFLVSIKPNLETGELTLYVVEFCSVVFHSNVEAIKNFDIAVEKRGGKKWLDLDSMRQNQFLMSVNGDVVVALHKLFGVGLEGIPNSFSA